MNHFPFLTCISTSFIAIITVLYTSAVLQQDLLDIMIIISTLVMSSIKIKCFVPYWIEYVLSNHTSRPLSLTFLYYVINKFNLP